MKKKEKRKKTSAFSTNLSSTAKAIGYRLINKESTSRKTTQQETGDDVRRTGC